MLDYTDINTKKTFTETRSYDCPDSVCGCVCEVIAGTCVLILLPFICIGYAIELCFCPEEHRTPVKIPPIPCFYI